MRVMIDRVVVINDLSQPKGGATALALDSATAFRGRGLPVTLVVGDDGRNELLSGLGVELVGLSHARLQAAGALRSLGRGLYNRAARALLTDWIARHDTPGTVYHLHGWAQILSPAVFAALRPVRRRTVLHAHDFFLTCPNGSYSFLRSGAICHLVPLSTRCVTANCDRRSYAHKLWRVARQEVLRLIAKLRDWPRILIIHEAMRSFLVRGGICDTAIQTVPNPVRPFVDQRIEAERNRDFLFVGRLEETKGPDLAAAAARMAGVPLSLVGDGTMRATLEAGYPETRLIGQLDRPDIAAVARRSRALLMPSRYPEPYGLVAAEALWSGLPVLVTDTAFLADDIERAGAGLAVNPRDTAGFAARLRAIAEDETLTRRMSEAAFTRTRSIGLDHDAWIDRLVGCYRTLLAGGRSGDAIMASAV